MFLRISIFLVLLRCGGPDDLMPQEVLELNATYMKYVPGAGGGKGIMFKVLSPDSVANLTVQKFVVNDIEIPAHIFYDKGTTLIEATLFYEDPEMTVDNENPDPVDPVLFNQEEFTGIMYYTIGTVPDSLFIDGFTEVEAPMYK